VIGMGKRRARGGYDPIGIILQSLCSAACQSFSIGIRPHDFPAIT
jgi:hypothetical protein